MTTDVAEAVVRIPTELIDESPTNPRKTWPPDEDLVACLRQQGVLQPIVVRARGDRFETVFGHRRLRAARHAELPTVPAIVRDLSDRQILEAQLVENLQRQDVHPLEEAEGMRRLMDEHGLSADDVAARIGTSRSSIYAKLKLLALGGAAREAFYAGELSPSHFLLLARIPIEDLQVSALEAFRQGEQSWNPRPMSFREAKRFVERQWLLLERAPFPTDDAELVPEAGSCATCPLRTGNQPERDADEGADVCTSPPCWHAKAEADWRRSTANWSAKGVQVLSRAESDKLIASWSEKPSDNAQLVSLKNRVAEDSKFRTWNQIVRKGRPAPAAIARAPSTGKAVPLYRRADLLRIARDAGALPKLAKAAASLHGAADRLKEQAHRAARDRAVEQLVIFVEQTPLARLGEVLRETARKHAHQTWSDALRQVTRRRQVSGPDGGVDALVGGLDRPEELLALMVELVFVRSRMYQPTSGKLLAHAGIDLAALEREELARLKSATKSKAKVASAKAVRAMTGRTVATNAKRPKSGASGRRSDRRKATPTSAA